MVLVPNAKRKVERKAVKSAKADDADTDVGQALRTVYEKAVEEQIPQEMLDLLGKLK
jgi:transcriptional/translational regulatory protein YebC/TACO1